MVPATITTTIEPLSPSDGDEVTCTVKGLHQHAGEQAEIILRAIDDVATTWAATISARVADDGMAEGKYQPSLGQEAVVEVAAVRIATPDGTAKEWSPPEHVAPGRCLVNPSVSVSDLDDVATRCAELAAAQERRYTEPLGDPNRPEVREHRVLCAVERLLMTTPMRLPGLQILPINEGSSGASEVDLLHGVLEALGGPPGFRMAGGRSILAATVRGSLSSSPRSGPRTSKPLLNWRGWSATGCSTSSPLTGGPEGA